MRVARTAVALVVLVAGLVLAGTAMADDPPVIDQYQEPLPTGGGNQHTGGNGGNGGGGGELPSSTQTNLETSVSAPVATALEEIATSPELGAPQRKLKDKQKQDRLESNYGGSKGESQPVDPTGSSEVVLAAPAPDSSLTDALAAVSDSASSYLIAVLLALAGVTLGGASLVVARRRQTG